MWSMAEKKILLIVSGGIAAYKSLELVRLVRDEAIEVIPVMTASAEKFVTPLSISILSGRTVSSSMYDVDNKLDFGHIELVRQSDLVVVAPATANLIAKTSNGLADDLASNILLATDKPVLMAPAMNVRMWTQTQLCV
jgi:phosphopantothenoylcysteine decarboxylase/phosphopantothenate--cysteine ligase